MRRISNLNLTIQENNSKRKHLRDDDEDNEDDEDDEDDKDDEDDDDKLLHFYFSC